MGVVVTALGIQLSLPSDRESQVHSRPKVVASSPPTHLRQKQSGVAGVFAGKPETCENQLDS